MNKLDHTVTIIHSDDLCSDIALIFSKYGCYDLAGKRVFIKPNMFRGAGVDDCIVTDPELISATVGFCKRHKAHTLVGDNPVPNKGRSEMEIAEQCGFIAAADGCFVNIGRHSRRIVKKDSLLQGTYVSEEVLDCDILVSLPKFRSHELTGLSIAVKNHFGIIPGNIKPAIHARFPKIGDFSRALLEVYAVRPADLIIVDALSLIDARGKKFCPRILVAGVDPHAIDYVCARIAGIDPWRIPTLRIARQHNMFDPDSITITGEIPVLKGYRTPFGYSWRGSIIAFFARCLYQAWLRRRPYIQHGRCTQCGCCEEICPVQAIDRQQIDYERCINCFCCFETCSYNAITTRIKL